MRYLLTYDLMESMRVTNQWMGSTARAMPVLTPSLALWPIRSIQLTAAWGEVTERSFARMVAKPSWGIYSIPGADGRDHHGYNRDRGGAPVRRSDPFSGAGPRRATGRKVLLVAPMSGHYATLLRSTVVSLLPDCDVYITDWHNARDIPVSRRASSTSRITRCTSSISCARWARTRM